MAITIEALGKQHNRATFTCGQADLDAWFRQRATQDERRNVARVFVAVDDDLGVVGFCSLGAFTLTLDHFPGELAGKLPRYDAIPAALIGRLARDVRVRGRGLGELLLADAIVRILGAGRALTVFAIVVDAKDERASRFYTEFGFRSFPLHPNRLFLLTSFASTALEKMASESGALAGQ